MGQELTTDHNKEAYDEILIHLQNAELAARNKEYKTAMTCARNAADVAKKWAEILGN